VLEHEEIRQKKTRKQNLDGMDSDAASLVIGFDEFICPHRVSTTANRVKRVSKIKYG
jgi:hypothetical protein